jgi:hypothetical protein
MINNLIIPRNIAFRTSAGTNLITAGHGRSSFHNLSLDLNFDRLGQSEK